ncbi:hypothetical protein [Miltoncostaea oceani]|uniref:hypothetical protein n=1 Tax=Miltoncostaea oceani TaxID=2843216 RepID=UPI001C3C9840|nr:hypothetical protein [Miltoncostaea oceani]
MDEAVERAALAVLNLRLDPVCGRVAPPKPDAGDWLVDIELPGESSEVIRGSTPIVALASAAEWVERALRVRRAG